MSLYIDNDIAVKLASLNLLAEALAAFGVPPRTVSILPTFRFKWKKWSKAHTPETQARVAGLIETATVLVEAPNDDIEALAGIDGLDQGEAILFALAAQTGAFVATGDKRSIAALAADTRASSVSTALARKIIGLEQTILHLLDIHGFDFVLDRVCSCADLKDTALRTAFGSGRQSQESNVREVLKQYRAPESALLVTDLGALKSE